MVSTITAKSAFDKAIKSDNLVVIDFFATWCGPCKVVAPKIEEMSKKQTNVEFYKVDVDESPDIAQEVGIRAMPTFVLYRQGQKIDEVVGANLSSLTKAIEKEQ